MLDLMSKVCSRCNVCDIRSESEPVLFENISSGEGRPDVLVIDSLENPFDCSDSIRKLTLLLRGVDFTYTNTVRCASQGEDRLTYMQRCSVWTRFLTEGVLVVLATKEAMQQIELMDEGEADEGTIYRSKRLGLVLCIPPVSAIGNEFAPKIERVLSQGGLL